ncbi:MAG: glycosyl hydrolase [Chlorobi bacterium]|nr:glycosyl hydrolase [Chlorobiota bacterium]
MQQLKRINFSLLILIVLFLTVGLKAEKNDTEKEGTLSSNTFSGLKFRSIGPAYASGRITDFAVNPENHSEYYIAAAAGNVWKTTNSGITYVPVFDNEGSYSIADVEIDPNNTHVVWVGTGEYNSQRAIGYGDGVYRSEDNGQSWENMGLKNSEHIGRIIIDPRNSDVYVAAQGPLWGSGGDRGLYKSTDNGKTWNKILYISENTGVTDVVLDPRNPDILYAASYQRRRHVWTLIDGGPESAIYKSVDAGKTWEKLENGLPSVEMGRIGLAISTKNPDYIYAIIEAQFDKGGVFRSVNRGASWEKMSDHVSASPQYYNRLFVDPNNENKVFTVETYSKYSLDGGKTWKNIGNKNRHVDDHALWIDPDNSNHYLIGCDGGVYETYDNAKNWDFKDNLPVTQFYRVSVDNAYPFYYVYGGTQDNNSMGGPSRTLNRMGILNSDWFVTNGGDGFKSQIDPKDPNIVYAQAQYGWVVRYDKKSGENIDIKPIEGKNEAYRWNWNAPLIISPHSHTRLYFAANKLFKSEDRGNSWETISPDLTRQLDRNSLKVMDKIQSVDAVAKNASTSLYGNIVSLTESPVKEGLLYVGTDDGLIQVSENTGNSWTRHESFSGVPKMTYVSCLFASRYNENVVYAAFDARKQNDLKPYLFKSNDKGKTWKSISANLPERGTVYSIIEDTKNSNLLFAGTEFGIFFTIDGGKKWIQLKGGLPTIAVRDIVIQERENDLVIATFGRGFYILDDYSSLRNITESELNKESIIFPVKDALMYVQKRGKSAQGQSYYTAKNPPFGATFTYYLKDDILSLKEKRKKLEKENMEKNIPLKYPSVKELNEEDNETEPYLIFTINDANGYKVRELYAPAKKGINRITWDFRYASAGPANKVKDKFKNKNAGMRALPGDYTVSLTKYENGNIKQLVGPVQFKAKVLNNTVLPAKAPEALAVFMKNVNELGRAIEGADKLNEELKHKAELIEIALSQTLANTDSLKKKIQEIKDEVYEIDKKLNGDKSISKRNENQPPSINDRLENVIYGLWSSTSDPTETMKQQYKITGELFTPLLAQLKEINNVVIPKIEKEMEALKAPWTPGRVPQWK